MSAFVKTKLLPSGHSIPAVALGVYQSAPGPETYDAVISALKLGYRHIDTATVYRNESDVGKAIRDSGIPRDELFSEGIVRDIGVSNFGELYLQKLAETWRVKAAVNQVELHPWLARADTVKYCEAWNHHGGKMHDRTLKQVARELGATSAQVLIAWSLAKGFVTLPKSVTESRIKENLEAAKLDITSEQMDKLNRLDGYFVTAWDPIKDHAV
ncbi:hypothetical protein PInf_023482 [Phytophthora infestans]|nr:hypothetical protein PInf_023482 [Phytophthora infestans]